MLQRGRTEYQPVSWGSFLIYTTKRVKDWDWDSRQRYHLRITKLAWGLRRIVEIEFGGTWQRRMLFVSYSKRMQRASTGQASSWGESPI